MTSIFPLDHHGDLSKLIGYRIGACRDDNGAFQTLNFEFKMPSNFTRRGVNVVDVTPPPPSVVSGCHASLRIRASRALMAPFHHANSVKSVRVFYCLSPIFVMGDDFVRVAESGLNGSVVEN